MKISVLTQPLGYNYGGLLQAYALQRFLKEQGHDVETLDRCLPKSLHREIIKNFLNFVRSFFDDIKEIPTERKLNSICKNLIQFRDENISLSRRIRSEAKLRDYYRKADFDAIIVGSDQVWRPKYSPSLFNFYLDFLDDVGSTAKRISYAASFGVDAWEYTVDGTRVCKALVHKFDVISVREKSAQELCCKYFGVAPEWVLDPTFLLDADYYRKLFNHKKNIENKGKLLTYILDEDYATDKVIAEATKNLNTDPFSIKPRGDFSEMGVGQLSQSQYPKVEDWLQSFDDASFVVTDSFHGCVFSIIFNKPFIAIGNQKRGASRFKSLLGMFNLEGRLVCNIDDVNKDLFEEVIDWTKVNKIRLEKAEFSRNFLLSSLGMKLVE